MDAVVVEWDAQGRVRFASGEWSTPSVQERRAIIHAAQLEMENLKELLEAMGADA
jgi:acyl-CoA reductase-like NAD-dependent aldehyde dehydrogenase